MPPRRDRRALRSSRRGSSWPRRRGARLDRDDRHHLGGDAVLDRSILDKEVMIGTGAVIGHGDDMTFNRMEPKNLSTGISVVGKRVRIPQGLRARPERAGGRRRGGGRLRARPACAGDDPERRDRAGPQPPRVHPPTQPDRVARPGTPGPSPGSERRMDRERMSASGAGERQDLAGRSSKASCKFGHSSDAARAKMWWFTPILGESLAGARRPRQACRRGSALPARPGCSLLAA